MPRPRTDDSHADTTPKTKPIITTAGVEEVVARYQNAPFLAIDTANVPIIPNSV